MYKQCWRRLTVSFATQAIVLLFILRDLQKLWASQSRHIYSYVSKLYLEIESDHGYLECTMGLLPDT